MNKQRPANKVLPKAGLNSFDWTFVQGSTFVFRLNFCAKNPAFGNTQNVMRKSIRDETIDLCYIDPPFNSKRNYKQTYNNIGTTPSAKRGHPSSERRGADRVQAPLVTDTWTWDDHANQCYEEILSNKNGVQTQQSIALINGLEKVFRKGCRAEIIIDIKYQVLSTVPLLIIGWVLQ